MATSSKQRQNRHRAKSLSNDERRLDCWLNPPAVCALARLARSQGTTKRAVLEALILAADEAQLRACLTDEEFDT